MYIADFEYPGTWLKMEDDSKAFEVSNLLSSMENYIADMAISLTMFEESRNNNHDIRHEWERDRNLEKQVEEEYKKSLPSHIDIFHDYHCSQIKKLVRKEKLKLGAVPRTYQHRFSFIHAHTFLSSADSFNKFLCVIFNETQLEDIKIIIDEFETILPMLRKVRNSAQHLEDRTRGYGKPKDVRKKVKMELKPIDNNFIRSEGGVLALSNLNNNKLGYTIDDGSYQEIEISEKTLKYITGLFQKLLNSLTWHGPSRICP